MSEIKCVVRDGKFVEPCENLSATIDSTNAGRRGVTAWNLINTKTFGASRSFVGVRTDAYKKGVAFNFCPFCGEAISAPFESEPAAPLPSQEAGE